MIYDMNERYKTATECIKTIDCKDCEHREDCRQWVSDNRNKEKVVKEDGKHL